MFTKFAFTVILFHDRNGKMAAQQIACTLPTFDWINTEYELYLDLTWYEPNRDFRLCFRQASIEKIVVRYTDAQRVTQPGKILPTGYSEYLKYRNFFF